LFHARLSPFNFHLRIPEKSQKKVTLGQETFPIAANALAAGSP
jgi:hypothetical protein